MSRDNALWQQCWRDQSTDFHQKAVNPYLIRFWPTLAVQGRVLVPLCGKSLDLLWLAQQGHAVLGVELSPLAVRAFFHENNLKPVKRRSGKFMHWQHGAIEILCGDFFQLDCKDLANISAVYDRAALTALPEDTRRAYLAHLGKILPPASKILLLTTEEPEEHENQANSVAEEISALYADTYHIELAHVDTVLEKNDPLEAAQRVEYKAYRLLPKGPA